MATTLSSPAVVKRRTVVPSRRGIPLPDALDRVACLPASRVVSADVVVKDVSAEEIAAAVSARDGASDAMVMTSELTVNERGDVAARRRRTVPLNSSVSEPAALLRASWRRATNAFVSLVLSPPTFTRISWASEVVLTFP